MLGVLCHTGSVALIARKIEWLRRFTYRPIPDFTFFPSKALVRERPGHHTHEPYNAVFSTYG